MNTAESSPVVTVVIPVMLALVAVAGTLAGVFLGVWADRRKSINESLIRKRLELYDVIIPAANQLLCFYTCVGDWKAMSPATMIEAKRLIDRTMYTHGRLFSTDVTSAYEALMDTFFLPFTSAGRDAQLKASVAGLKAEWGSKWDPAWDTAFWDPIMPDTMNPNPEDYRRAYAGLATALAIDIGAQKSATASR